MAMHGDSSKKGAPQHKASATEAARFRRRLGRAFAFVIVLAVAFCAGFFVRGYEPLMTSLGIGTGESLQNPGQTVTGNTYDSVSARVAEVEGILQQDSLDSYDLDSTTSSILDSFVAATADPYLRYFDSARYAVYRQESAKGSYEGIGVLFGEYNGEAYVVDVFDGSSAQTAGVQEGDFVVAIDGDSSQKWTTAEVTNTLAACEAGETIVVTWRRPSSLEADGGETFNTTLTTSAVSEPNVTSWIDGSVGYVSIAQLSQNSATLVRDAVTSLTEQGATSFVLDLRDCPGGYLTQAVDIASLFVRSGVIVQVQTRDATTTKSASGDIVTEAPLVVLVNGNTAAAAEVLAGALQDSDRAELVGTTTLGKGSVQVVRELSFGGALRYTAAHYLTPLGRDFAGVGISPDFAVEASEGSDNQRAIAMETAASLVQG